MKLRAARLIGLLTKREAARRLGVHPQTVLHFLIPRAGVECVRVGYKDYIRESDLERLRGAIVKPRCAVDLRSEDARARATLAAVPSTGTAPAAGRTSDRPSSSGSAASASSATPSAIAASPVTS
jgi:hypothetical protein